MRSRILALLLIGVALMLAACGSPSKEDVLKKLSGKWNDTKGYELEATMEINTGSEPRSYDVEVWHTKPDFYRVHVTQEGKDDAQMIVRNEEGVFVVTPSLGKTYKFQSDWPAQNSQGYLIGTLSDDIKADENAKMAEKDKMYVFETATTNNHKKILPIQHIYIDKKTLLPTRVSILDENKEEKIRITFKKITLGTARKAEDYKVEMNAESKSGDEEENSDAKDQSEMRTYYPSVLTEWQGVTLLEEEIIQTDNGNRLFMTYGGNKEFVIVQEAATKPDNNKVAVSVEGDPVDLGFTIAALTDKSIRWEQDGIAFFVASDKLSQDELIAVALSMTAGEMK